MRDRPTDSFDQHLGPDHREDQSHDSADHHDEILAENSRGHLSADEAKISRRADERKRPGYNEEVPGWAARCKILGNNKGARTREQGHCEWRDRHSEHSVSTPFQAFIFGLLHTGNPSLE